MSKIIPTLRYDDARLAIDFLHRAFGFEEHAVHEQDGVVVHAEVRLGDDFVMLGEHRENGGPYPANPTTIYVVIDDPDGLHERAVAAGAEIVRGLTDEDYGSRDFAAKDPGGHVWSFGTYTPG